VLSINGVCTLADVVIIDPTQVDFVSWATFFHGVVMRVAAQVKDGLIFHTDMKEIHN
jgi:hypothetical protein